MRPYGISFIAFVAALVLRSTSITNSAQEERWIEVIETYRLPFDPDWRESALAAAKFGRFPYTNAFREDTGSMDRAAEYADRLEKAGKNDRTRKAVIATWQKEVESFKSSASAARELFIVRAWDGIQREAVTFVLGEKQRGAFARCKTGAVLNIASGASNVPDHLQARGRRTITAMMGGRKTPSDFLFLRDEIPDLMEIAFGEIDRSRLTVGVELGSAEKHPAAGSGVVFVSVDRPAAIPIDPRYPWYCKFKLFELDNDGDVVREVRFEGSEHAVAISGVTAKARVEVKSPSPYGYQAQVTSWFGVAPTAALTPAPSGLTPNAPTVPPPTPSAPSAPSVPTRPPGLTPPLPGEGPARPAAPKPPSDSPLPDPEPSPPQP